MISRSPNSAVGGNVFLAMNDQKLRIGLRARYRHWLGSRASLDLAPGVILLYAGEWLHTRFAPGGALLASVSAFEWVRGSAQVEYTPAGVGAQLGVGLGSQVGLVAGVVPLILGVLVALNGGYD